MGIISIAVEPKKPTRRGKNAISRDYIGLPRQQSLSKLLESRLRRSENFDHDHSFSWQHCVVSLVSYALLLSDIARAGLGIRLIGQTFPRLEPDSYVFFGPLEYTVTHLNVLNTTSGGSTRYWPYKYDTTSIAMRSIAQHLQLTDWPRCVLYKESCDESIGLDHRSVFAMVDSLIAGVKAHRLEATKTRSRLTTRTECRYRDRLHHYAFPWFFESTVTRTTQASYHSFNSSQLVHPGKSLCSLLPVTSRPHSCDQHWTNYARVRRSESQKAPSQSTKRIWDSIPKQLDKLSKAYPGHLVDFVVVDSTDDPTVGGLSYQGRQYFDVVVFARARNCTGLSDGMKKGLASCTTTAIEDFRYEGASFTMNAPAWFFTVAMLRLIGQTYTWLRVVILAHGCYSASRHQHRNATVLTHVRAAVRTFFLIPSQVVIYGSRLPITLYAVAHLIDSPAVYQLVDAYYNSWLGEVSLNASDFLQQCAVSMRTVWILGIVCHAVQSATSTRSWSPVNGVLGMTELSITLVASLTILAQYRSVVLRDTEILQVHAVTPSTRRHQLHSSHNRSLRSVPTALAFGSPIDRQCLLCGVLVLVVIALLCSFLNQLSPRWFPLRVSMYSRTLVPFSAGILWPCDRLVVSWCSSLVHHVSLSDKQLRKTPFRPKPMHPQQLSLVAFPSMLLAGRHLHRPARNAARSGGMVIRHTRESEQIQHDMHSVNKRSRHVQSMIVLLNLAVMTDPITVFVLRIFRGRWIGLYECKLTQRCFLLPLELAQSDADIPIDWNEFELVAVANTKDLGWNDLLFCG